VYGIGVTLPRRHHVTRTALYAQPPDTVWAVIADMERSPSWRTEITRVERLPDRDGHPVWNQVSRQGSWPLEIVEATPPTRLVAVVADSSQGFGGRWTYTLTPEGTGTRVTIAEDGFVDPPMFRFIARYLIGLTRTLDTYLEGLGRHFGEAVTPVAA
jgi:uncharacterized protein YndB with AHSA1/START domain